MSAGMSDRPDSTNAAINGVWGLIPKSSPDAAVEMITARLVDDW
jgi:hypothetical protein